MDDARTEVEAPGLPLQTKGTGEPPPTFGATDVSVPASGRRAAFRDVRRQLTEDELKNPGVQKLHLAMLEESDEECQELRTFVNLYHESDKKAAVLAEKLLTKKAIEVYFGVGVALGGTVIGLAPYFWAIGPVYGVIAGILGLAMLIGSATGRIVSK